ncbi:MAG: Holliday junction resolvase RuvX [Thermoanaerobaculia bacterium]
MGIVAVDFGTKRIGIAVSDSLVLASPWGVIENPGDDAAAIDAIAAVIEELGADRIVFGIPRGGRKHADPQMEQRYGALAQALRQRTCKDVILWDESYSTTEAASLRRDRGRKKSKQRDAIDSEAATVFLQAYLDAMGRSQS